MLLTSPNEDSKFYGKFWPPFIKGADITTGGGWSLTLDLDDLETYPLTISILFVPSDYVFSLVSKTLFGCKSCYFILSVFSQFFFAPFFASSSAPPNS